VLGVTRRDDVAVIRGSGDGGRLLTVTFAAPGSGAALVASWPHGSPPPDAKALLEDAAHSLRLALEREEAWVAHQEAVALRRSQELQRGFLSRLSHELRTPLTAIRGYASSLLQPDVTWDGESQQRFLVRISAESARLGRLVDDLLDFSAIESGVMRLQPDWCDIRLVVEAAISCLPPECLAAVSVTCNAELPAVWADHDRLEQVFVNLLTNAFRHNPPGTKVNVVAGEATSAVMGRQTLPFADGCASAAVEISVMDDGSGFPAELALAPFESARRQRSPSAGAGLGLSIARGIVEAHGGRIDLVPSSVGTAFRIALLVEAPGSVGPGSDPQDAAPDEPGTLVAPGARAPRLLIQSGSDA
jgi:signal transduction histidine kinase